MKIADFDYDLPPGLIAQLPTLERDRSRLLILDRASGGVTERIFADLPRILRPGDLLVLNDTRVIPARLRGRLGAGGACELLLVRDRGGGIWEVLAKPADKLRPGRRLVLADGRIRATVEGALGGGRRLLRIQADAPTRDLLERLGEMPLPPYIKRPHPGPGSPRAAIPRADPSGPRLPPPDPALDRDRYQTVYARTEGAIAAPTAGLHFTPALLDALRERGVEIAQLTLHVGIGTFKPVRVEEVERHVMEAEECVIPEETVAAIKAAWGQGRRVIAVGTTTVRALEHGASSGRDLQAGPGRADLFIFPPFRFRVVDALVTNFHLPRSTLLMLVSAFAGRERILAAYREAIARRFRFYSYGDAMLIF